MLKVSLLSILLLQTLPAFSQYLYLWTGQSSSITNASDFVAVIDYNPKRATYGKVISTVPVGVTGNEPHHTGLSANGQYFVAGGLLSFLSGLNSIYVFKVPSSNSALAKGPALQYSFKPSGGCVDAFRPISDSKFLVSLMCNNAATSPGKLITFDACTGTASDFQAANSSALTAFNPHGFVQFADGSVLSADYIDPITLTLSSASQVVFRNTVRYFDASGVLKSTYTMLPQLPPVVGSGTGFMDIGVSPASLTGKVPKHAYFFGSNDGVMYLIKPDTSLAPIKVFDTAAALGTRGPSACILGFTPDGKRLLVGIQLRYVLLFDISNFTSPVLLQKFDFCAQSGITIPVYGNATSRISYKDFCAQAGNVAGSHAVIIDQSSPASALRFVVVNYFLSFGLAQFAGTRAVHSFTLNSKMTSFSFDTKFDPNNFFAQNKGSPHHGVFVPEL